ncbi:MAG: Gfo/Idh/MocA family oxidoreductase [Bacteroidota bacterium]|nr:Gfo/Idh/MocA family oxidoreductase [Bacteroidota bacterium]MDE2957919.1 Gfo/Idh/MocA family oxidoreductase [Bacteroidota bacterium]
MNQVRIAQVGAGNWGRNLLRNFLSMDQVNVVAVCDEDQSVLQAASAQDPKLHVTATFDDILQRDDLDGVVIATQTPLHFAMARDALRRKLHVFVEKPMAQTAKQAEELVALSDEVDRHLMVGHLLLYHPAFRHVEQLIHNGDLGRVYYLYSVRVNLGIIRRRENALDSLAPHDLSIALAYLNQKPVAVSATGQAYLQPDVCDIAFATVFFEQGAMAHLHTSWLDPHKIRKVTVVGERKMAVVDDCEAIEKVRVYDKGVTRSGYASFAESMTIRSGDIHIPRIGMQEPLRIECAHFIDCIRSGRPPRTDARNGLAVVRLLEAAQQSLRHQGARVPVGP